MDKRAQPNFNSVRWTTQGANILAEENLKRIREALEEDWVGGIHLYYGGGGSGDAVAFSRYDTFHSCVVHSRPGDLFVLWSVAEMRRRGLLLIDKRSPLALLSGNSLLAPSDLDRVRRYVAEREFNEVLSISVAEGDKLEAVLTDRDWDKFLNAAQRAAVPNGALCALPFTQIDSPEFYLVKAKRPNGDGQVPLGGAY